MPGWLIHLALAYLMAKLFKIRHIGLVLFGALIPDVARILSLIDIANISATGYYAYLEPMHSPFLVIILILSTSLLVRKKLTHSLFYLSFGALIHTIADLLQKEYYIGKLLLYPFSYIPFKGFHLIWPDSTAGIILSIISFFILIYAIFDKQKKSTKFTFKKINLVILLLLIYLVTPLLTFNQVIENDPYITQFENKNKELYFSYSEIISEKPLIVRELDYEYEVINNLDLKKGEWFSAKANLIENKVFITGYHKHIPHLKIKTSAIGLILFIIIFFKRPKRNKKSISL